MKNTMTLLFLMLTTNIAFAEFIANNQVQNFVNKVKSENLCLTQAIPSTEEAVSSCQESKIRNCDLLDHINILDNNAGVHIYYGCSLNIHARNSEGSTTLFQASALNSSRVGCSLFHNEKADSATIAFVQNKYAEQLNQLRELPVCDQQ